jgi:prepilin-type N-terminal cleavage/methylation domain-containing protein
MERSKFSQYLFSILRSKMRKNNKNRKGFTLIELLVVIAIIAILAVVVVLTLNPAELLRQSRDSNRMSDFATLKSAIGLYSADVNTSTPMYGSGGTASDTLYTYALGAPTTSTTYVGAASTSFGFSSTINSYASMVVVNSRAVDGTGWIPLAFSKISSGAPIGALPVDPTDSTSSPMYIYVYAATSTTYKLSTHMESFKYGNGGPSDVVSTDGGNATGSYEQGTNLSL